MEFYNSINIKMENKEAAVNALEVIRKVLQEGDYSRDYTTKEMANDFVLNGSEIVLEEDSYFLVEDIRRVFEDILKEIASEENIHSFNAYSDNYSEDSDSNISACYKEGRLNIKERFFPNRFTEHVPCSECGEDAIWLDDYEPNEEFTCPKCGEIFNLTKMYEQFAPVFKTKEFTIR